MSLTTWQAPDRVPSRSDLAPAAPTEGAPAITDPRLSTRPRGLLVSPPCKATTRRTAPTPRRPLARRVTNGQRGPGPR